MSEVTTLPALEVAEEVAPSEEGTRRRYVIRKLLRSPTFLIGAGILLFWVAMALFSTHLTRYAPNAIDPYNTLSGPSAKHWFGTDDSGRDVLSRTMAGARSVLEIAPLAMLLALAAGSTIALVAGYKRGLVDEIIMRGVDVLLCLPVVVAGIVVVSALGHSMPVIILVIAVLFMPSVSRTVRSAVIAEREREYVLAARLRGENAWFIMIREILPNCAPPIIVEGSVRLGYAVFTSATLSFLGFGLQPPSPDWGLTISTGQQGQYLQVAPWAVLFPALALASLVVSANLVADSLRRTLAE
jgi:peptide/nickel transport system permease protein